MSPDVMVAQLSGATRASVAVVRHGEDHYFIAPKRLGGVRKVPADSMTDCLNYSVRELGKRMSRKKRK